MSAPGERAAAFPSWATGVLAGAVTPFDADLRVDEAELRRHLSWLAASGVASIVVAADTGEGQHLRRDERTRVLDIAVDEVGHVVPVLTGLISAFTADATECAREAEAHGAAGLQVFPPPAFLGGALDPGLAASFYEAIADATALPLLAYRPPLELGYGLDDAVVERVLTVDAVAGLKESSFDEDTYRRSRALTLANGRVAFMSGADPFVMESLEIGADGLALALAALAPGQYVDLLERWRENGAAAARPLARVLSAVPSFVFARPFRDFRARLKEGLRQLELLGSAAVRPPLVPLGEAEAGAVRAMLEASGLTACS
jgi:4-hydroxy-tetrahydrodipicolinate synthase